MAFLTINGIEMKIATATRSPVRLGERSRAHSGRARKSERARKREWTLYTGPLDELEAPAVAGLLEGDGHHFPFDSDLYSERGIGPLAGYGAAVTVSPGKFGPGFLTVSGGESISFPVQLPATWTLLLHRRELGAWHAYAVNSDGQKWRDAVRDDGADTSWLSVTAGTVTLGDADPLEIDDLVCLPYLTPPTWPPIWAAAAAPFGALPWLNAAGDLTRGPLVAMAEVTDAETITLAGGELAERLNVAFFEL